MGDVNESLDFLALLDEVEEDTVSRLVNEMSQTDASSCQFGDRDALDILSICDSASASNSMASATEAHTTEANNFAAEIDGREVHVQQTIMARTRTVARDCDKPHYFPEADYIPQRQNVAMNRNFPANNHTIVHTAGAGQCVPPRKRGRWQFSKWQREHLDGVFKKNMYPSKWKLTELCTALQVPMRTLRNRRWRLRKSQGLTGDLHTRGSRAMLPDKEETAAEGCHRSTTTASRMDCRSPALTIGSSIQVPEVAISSPKPIIPSLFPLMTTASLSSPSLSPILPSPSSSSSLCLMSTPHPLFGDMGQNMGEYRWGLPSLTASWSLPASFNWLNGSPLPSCLPFAYSTSQWHSCAYSLPVLPPLCPPDMTQAVRQSSTGGRSKERNMNTAMSLSYTKSAFEKPAPTPTYLFYNKPSHCLSAGQGLPVLVHPTAAATLECPVTKYGSSAVFHSCPVIPGPPRPVTSLTLPKATEQSQATQHPGSYSEVAILSSSLTKNKETSSETEADGMSKSNDHTSNRMQYCSQIVTPSTPQSFCTCGLCLNSTSTPVWTSSLPNPAERTLDPSYPKTVHPPFPSLSTSTLQYAELQAGSSILPAETAKTAPVTLARDDLFQYKMLPSIREESEDVDVITVSQSTEEEITSTSDYAK